MSDLCGQWTGKQVDMLTGEVRAGTVWCKSWTCEYCAPLRLKQLQRDAVNGFPNKFITLTSRYRPDEMTPDEAAQELVHAWRMTIQRAKREALIDDIQYIAVFELTKRGWPHLHILARCTWLAQAWLSDRMAEYANSPRVDIRAIKGRKRAAWYVAKYTSKGPDKLRGCKRYWRTLGYDLSEKRKDKPLHDHFRGYLSCNHIQEVAALYETHGYWLTWDNDHSFVAAPRRLDFWQATREQWKRSQAPPYKEHRRCESSSKTTP